MLQQPLSDILGLVKAALVQQTVDKQEGSVSVLVLGVNDQVVLRVSTLRVEDKLDHLDDVGHLAAVAEDQVKGGEPHGPRGLKPGKRGREAGLWRLTIDNVKNLLVIVVPDRPRVLVVIEPVVQELVG